MKNVHPVYSARKWTNNLLITSLSVLTTRPLILLANFWVNFMISYFLSILIGWNFWASNQIDSKISIAQRLCKKSLQDWTQDSRPAKPNFFIIGSRRFAVWVSKLPTRCFSFGFSRLIQLTMKLAESWDRGWWRWFERTVRIKKHQIAFFCKFWLQNLLKC